VTPHHHTSLTSRLRELIAYDRSNIVALLAYTVLNALLMLGVPLIAQALVNTIAAGIFFQPLVVLSLLLLVGLLLYGGFRLLQLSLVEVIQQHLFTRFALRLGFQLPLTTPATLNQLAPGDPLRRYFEIMTIQKTWGKLLLDGPMAVFQISIGLVVLAFYSPWFIGFNALLLLVIVLVLWGLSWNGLRSSIDESVEKYMVASKLETLTHSALKSGPTTAEVNNNPEQHDIAFGLLDKSVARYLSARGSHFRVLYRHTAGMYLSYAVASAGILSIGGWLVINRQLSLGQLVAAELIVVSILAAFEKLVLLLDPFYDLLTSLDKLGHLLDLPYVQTPLANGEEH
jgi:ABC-type bacteriocin/lantibiotic exporter with double-glycine peptidase domain